MEGIIMLSANLKSIRKSRKITQEALASKLNVTRQTISKWENGQSVPDAESLTQIAELLDISVQELLGEEVKENKTAGFKEKPTERKYLKIILTVILIIMLIPIIYTIFWMFIAATM